MKVFLATPAYDGKVVPQFEESLKASLRVLKDAGIPAHWEALSGCCYLPIARNKLVKKFLESDATDLVFLDADIEWQPDDLIRLLSHPVEIVGGPYRHKTWEETYPVWIRTTPDHRPWMPGLSDLVQCWVIPTGFMRISRSVFDDMIRHYGESLEVDEFSPDGQKMGHYLNFFDTTHLNRLWWGEDANFCRRWALEMHRSLYVDPQIKLSHWGKSPRNEDMPFVGDYHDYLSRMPGGANDPGYQGNKCGGWTTKKELQWLYATAKRMSSIVEIGSFRGRSAHALLSGCKGEVACVDSWLPLPWEKTDTQADADERFADFVKNTAEFPGRRIIRDTSLNASRLFQDRSVDMVWIDGDHDHDPVLSDIEAWLPKAVKMICGHDYNYYGWPEVKKAVDEYFGDRVRNYESIWFVEL